MHRHRLPILIAISLVAILLAPVRTASAHAADLLFQTYVVELTPDAVLVRVSLTPGPLLAYSTWYEADRNDDGAISEGEAAHWAASWAAALDGAMNKSALTWQVDAVTWPGSVSEIELNSAPVTLALRADATPAPGDSIRITSTYNASVSVYRFRVESTDALPFETPVQENGALTVTLNADENQTRWESGQINAAGTQTETQSPVGRLTTLLTTPDRSGGFFVLAFALAVGLGAIHALTPGHGKTLVAAYLVGTRGTPLHAVVLGGIVTLTHTGTVVALGLITLALSRFIVPTTLFPLLEVASGLLILGLGLALLRPRLMGLRSVRAARRAGMTVRTVPTSTATRSISINEPVETRPFDDLLPGGQSAAAVAGDAAAQGGITWRGLVALGVSGGLVPCPDAIAILLLAIAINQMILGLGLVLTFSVGLAVVLIAIGLAVVQGRGLLARFNAFDGLTVWLPAISAVIILFVGLALTVGAVRSSAFQAAVADISGRIQGQGAAYDFETAGILYLTTDPDTGYQQVFRVPAAGGMATRITDAESAVLDFAPSPDGRRLAYTTQYPGGSTIWLMDLRRGGVEALVTCDLMACNNPAWGPDGRSILYERLDGEAQLTTGLPSLWRVDVRSGEQSALFATADLPGLAAAWSPDGAWLSFVSPRAIDDELMLYRIENGETRSLIRLGTDPAIWNPAGGSLLYIDTLQTETSSTRILRHYDIETDTTLRITPDYNEDSAASWHPDGDSFVVVRRATGGRNPARPDTTLELIAADGQRLQTLVYEPGLIFGSPAWSPDGRHLVYTRIALNDPDPDLGIWVLDVETGEATGLVPSGFMPAWVP